MKGLSTATGVLSPLFYQSNSHLEIVKLYASNNITILEASATLLLPISPPPITGALALWSAITLDKDFIQGVTENAPTGVGYCANLGSNWCNIAYALTPMPNITNGTPVIAVPGARVRTHYLYNSETSMWDQNLYVNDQPVSNISTSKGQTGSIFYIAIECAAGICPAAPPHSWENLSITLSDEYSAFQRSGSWGYGATGGEMSTPDGGKTWTFTTLNVPINQP
ncbi:hypothetical protein HD806DRAFT_551323 [Xylariaceae sp. AK1471]|nr:hypothetical protein HD806DRAFT_551323 [Xylariaceae sp. AK1471]